ncbi:hypothetical protein ABIA33_007211 [Streptacidiphilus sp. MAP12-16]|uniref:protein kinase domain-containing protein n=1 Tax=Streptacidiphilus sp. MAP12-16 TaxID=3156300 RepID=UPI003516A4CE
MKASYGVPGSSGFRSSGLSGRRVSGMEQARVAMNADRELGGRYVVTGLLGRGGMAEVHLARDLRLDRLVAVKVLRPDLAVDPTYLARFRREALSAASLNHTSIVTVYDSGEDVASGALLPYLVMEYVPGSTLADLLREGQRPTPQRALELTDGVLDALSYAHAHGIVHRDIKPANVMLTADGQVKVMDLGIARPLGMSGMTLTHGSMVIGTAEYLSPEQARGETVDARADLYSVGCLLYELLTGRPPFQGDTPLEVAWHQLQTPPEPPSTHAPALSRACDDLVLRALAKDRDQRFRSAAEMRTALDRTLTSLVAAVPAARATPAATRTPTPTLVATGPAARPPAQPAAAARPAPARRGSPAKRAVLALAACAVVVTAAGAYAVAGSPAAAHTVPSPDLTGKTLAQARLDARAAGLHIQTVVVGGCTSPGVPAHRVCGQLPAAGTAVTTGTGVTLRVAPLLAATAAYR